MAKLNQIIAVEKGKKGRAVTTLTDAYQIAQKVNLLSGMTRHYTPANDEGDHLPAETTLPQINMGEYFNSVMEELISFYDVVLTKEAGNQGAKADIKVDGVTLASDVPVTFLLFLEKQLKDIRTFISKVPVLDPARTWTWDANRNAFVTDEVKSTKTKKEARPIVLYDATPEHPAQTQLITEDIIVGTWSTIHISTAIPAVKREAMLARVDQLIEAVKVAREEANSTEVVQREAGQALLEFIFTA